MQFKAFIGIAFQLRRAIPKSILYMKLTATLCIIACLQAGATGYTQTLSITVKNKPLHVVFREIEKKTGYSFVYSKQQLIDSRPVTMDTQNVDLKIVLQEIFKRQRLTFTIEGKYIAIKIKTPDPVITENIEELVVIDVSGRITNEKGEPIAGATIRLKGSEQGTSSNDNGEYILRGVNEKAILIISFVGYDTKEIPVKNNTSLNIQLALSERSLDQVVVVGYGTAKKATLTGSVVAIKGEDLVKSPAVNLSNSLAGRLAGVTAVTRSGEPGNDGSTIRIRGSNTLGDNSPLIVVDGIANRSMERLDPSDIESMTVLKDASAAIYGAQAANGVILITTKRGKAGKPKVALALNKGWSRPTVLPDMADAATYAQMINEIKIYRQRDIVYTPDMIQKYRDGSDPWSYPNTDWFGATFKPYSSQNYSNISVSGGSESMQYLVSVGTRYQDGAYRNSATNYSQANFRSNIDAKISKNIRLSLNLSGRQENRNYPTKSSGTIFSSTLRGKPNIPAYWPNGLAGPDIERGENPVVMATSATGYDKEIRYIMESIMKLDITIPWIKGLSFTANASIDKNVHNHKLWQQPWTLNYWDGVTYDANNIPHLTQGKRGFSEPRLTQGMIDGNLTTLNALINYTTSIGKYHHIKALAGTERSTGTSMNFSAFRRYFISTAADQMFAGGDLEKDNNGSASSNARLNYFGRLNYDFNEKYLAEFVFRYDGSYIFPEKKRFGFFPGISLGWRISEEKFWKENISFINSLKIRGSWGQTGNDRIDPYQFLSNYGFGSPAVFNGNLESKSLTELRIPNPNVTWEIANQSNIGIDGQLFDGKFNFSADYFNNLRTNILHYRNASVPLSSGITLPRENIGKVNNKGFEIELGYHNEIKDLEYSVSINGGYQKNKIKFWDETPGAPEYQRSTGHPMNSSLYYQAIGIFKDDAAVNAYPHWANARPGDIIFQDINNDGSINGLDRVRINKTDLPTFTGGLNISVQYKRFYTTILLQAATGALKTHFTFSGESGNYYNEDAIGRWTPDNPNASKPRTWNTVEEYWMDFNVNNTYWLRNNNYLRLKNWEIGYNVSGSFTKKIGIDQMRFYFNGLNLFTWDNLKNYDPETNTENILPSNKVLNVGLNVTF